MKRILILFVLTLFIAPVLALAGPGDSAPSFLVKLTVPYVGAAITVPAGTVCRVEKRVGDKIRLGCGVAINDHGAEISTDPSFNGSGIDVPADAVETIYALPGTCQQ